MAKKKKIAVVAIGGNSLMVDQDRRSSENQHLVVRRSCHQIADMVEAGWDVVLTHGNGPQVGFTLRRAEIANRVEGLPLMPLDVCGANSQGAIGYSLQQNLQNEFHQRGIKKSCVGIVTQTLVWSKDKAFRKPDKPIGGFFSEEEAKKREKTLKWSVMEDAGRGWRRVVPSPRPKEIVEMNSIRTLVNQGVVVISCGGGGIPVIDKGKGEYVGTSAVIDKDLASSLLATNLEADLFVISTAVEKVAINFGKSNQEWLSALTAHEARAYLKEGTHFAAGSMAPKIGAVVEYLENGGKEALITNPDNIGRALRGETGTWMRI